MIAAALAYARAGWPVFPCWASGPRRKTPLVKGGFTVATIREAQIAWWWQRWPGALIGTPTGRRFVVLDIDPRHGGDETMVELGFAVLPATPTVRTAGGGWHLYFAPAEGMRNTAGARGRGVGAGLDWRGVGGYVIVPAPGSGYEWMLETRALPLAAVPERLLPRPPEASPVGAPAVCDGLSPYGEAALLSAAEVIMAAADGEQERALNDEAYAIGRLAGAGGVPPELALDVLLTAARAMRSFDPARPWSPAEVETKVRRAFAQGLAKPRRTVADDVAEFDRAMEAVDG